jgi:hypothetical protein
MIISGSSNYNTYWAADNADKCANFLIDYQYQWGDYYSGCTLQSTWLRNYLAYYLPCVHPSQIDTSLIPEGVQGELLRMYTPDMRVAIRQLVAIVTKLRLAFSCTGMVGGSEVIEEIKLGNALTDQIVQLERLDLKGPRSLEGSIVTGKWFLKTIWSTERGLPTGYKDENGRPITTGGVEVMPVSVFDSFYDVEYENYDQRLWHMVRVTRSRWDLIAEHPDLRDYILALPATCERTNYNFFLGNRKFNYDSVDVWEFYHRPSPALPDGRILIFSDSKTIYYDDKNKYGCIPIEEMSPENILATGMAYPKMTDLMATQEMLDNTISAVASNSSAFAVQNVLIPRGANINSDEINGMRFVSYTPQNVPGGGKPEPLNLSATAPETFKFIELLSGKIRDLSMVAGSLVGNPPAGITSGTALATLAASSIDVLQPFNLAYYYCMEKTMGHAINAFQRFADLDQVVQVQGKNNQMMPKQFNKSSIKNLSGVKIANTNPLMTLISGRIEIAEKLMGMPRELWADYCAILEGQPLQNITRGETTKKDLIEIENESMNNGIAVPVLATDDHAKHIQCHVAEISEVSVRMGGKNLQVFLDHIMEHYTQSKQVAPDLLFMAQTGQMPQTPPPPSGPSGTAGPGNGSGLASIAGANQPNAAQSGNGQVQGDVAEPAQDLLRRHG